MQPQVLPPTKNSGVVAPPKPTVTKEMYPAALTNIGLDDSRISVGTTIPGYAKGGSIGKKSNYDQRSRKKDGQKPGPKRDDQAKDTRKEHDKAEKKILAGPIADKPGQPAWTGDLTQPTKAAVNNPMGMITKTEVDKMEVKDKQLIDKDSGQVKNIPQAKLDTVDSTAQGQVSTAADPNATEAHTVDTELGADKVKDATENMQAAQGTVSEDAQVTAAQALPSAKATVQGQLEGLMQQFEGGETPAWAAGAMRMANTAMASRGLGSSSMAGAAITQAAMESAISIAVTDAATFSQFEMQNLNNRQQARLVNAQAFLQMDMANLNNRQQTEIFKSQAIIQSLFTDQAAENATRQFNASSQNQTDQFFANLKTQVATFNAAQKNAMETFNVGEVNTTSRFNTQQTNAMRQFNTQVKADVKKFNAQNRLVIDQSNAEWRRQIATVNNANQNEANRINAQAATGMTMAAFNNMWQQERDLMAYAFTAGENMQQRAHEILLAKMGVELDQDLLDQQNRGALWEAAGGMIGEMFDGLFS
jgi:uncharacterized protein (DUF2384 family)